MASKTIRRGKENKAFTTTPKATPIEYISSVIGQFTIKTPCAVVSPNEMFCGDIDFPKTWGVESTRESPGGYSLGISVNLRSICG